MEALSLPQLTLLLTAIVLLVKLLDRVIEHFIQKDRNYLSPKQHGWLKELWEMHHNFDPDSGAPIWYFQKQWIELQKANLEISRSNTVIMAKISDCLVRLERNVEKVKERVDKNG